MLTGHGGYPTKAAWAPAGTGRELTGPDDAVAAVADLAGRGATAIKVSLNAEAGPTPSDAELMAICDEAHRLDLPVTAHAQGAGQVERALGAGCRRARAHAVDHGCRTRSSRRPPRGCGSCRRSTSIRTAATRRRSATAVDNLRRFHAAGGTVIYGTDLGNGPIPAGIHTREVLLLREAGLEPEEVLQAMVRAPLDLDAPADLIALGRSPLDDPSAFDDLRLVVREGRVVSAR